MAPVLPSITAKRVALWVLNWKKSGAIYMVSGAIGVTYFCEWKDVLINVPFLNYRWKREPLFDEV